MYHVTVKIREYYIIFTKGYAWTPTCQYRDRSQLHETFVLIYSFHLKPSIYIYTYIRIYITYIYTYMYICINMCVYVYIFSNINLISTDSKKKYLPSFNYVHDYEQWNLLDSQAATPNVAITRVSIINRNNVLQVLMVRAWSIGIKHIFFFQVGTQSSKFIADSTSGATCMHQELPLNFLW